MKYNYAYDKNGVVLSADECEKNEMYFADYDLTVKLVKAEGEQRQLYDKYHRIGNSIVEQIENIKKKIK